MQTKTITFGLLLLTLMLQGCASKNVITPTTCPPPRPLPAVLLEPVSVGPSLTVQLENSLKKFRESLSKAESE